MTQITTINNLTEKICIHMRRGSRTASIWVSVRLQNSEHNTLQVKRDGKTLAVVTFTGTK